MSLTLPRSIIRRHYLPWIALVFVVCSVAGAAAPTLGLALFLGVVLLGWSASSPRFGVTASVVASLLIPLPLAFKLGPVSLTIGRLIGFAFLIGWLAAISRPDGPVPRRTGLEVGLAAFLVSLLASLAVNSPHLANQEVTAAIRRILVFAIDYFAFFFAAVSVLRAGWTHINRVLRIVCATVVVMGLIGVVERLTSHNIFSYVAPALPGGARTYVASLAANSNQLRGGHIRVQATTEGPNEFGAVIVMTLPLIVHYSKLALSAVRRLTWLVGAVICLVAGLFTESRSVVVGLVLDVAIYGIFTLRSRLDLRRTVLVALALGVALAVPSFRNNFTAYFRGAVSAQDTSISGRQVQANLVLGQFSAHPFFGTGPQTLSEQEFLQRGQTVHVTTDDSYLQTLGEQGLLGLVTLAALFLSLLLVGLRTISRSPPAQRSLPAALLAAAVCYTVLTYLFDMLDFYGPTKLFFLLMAGLLALGRMETRAAEDRSVAVFDPRWLVSVLAERRRLVVRWLLLGLVAAAAVGIFSPSPYQATAQVLIEQPTMLLESPTSASILRDGLEFLPTYAEAVRSDAVLTATASDGRLLTTEDLRAAVSAAPVPGALILTITASQRHAAAARDLATTVANRFVALSQSIAPQQDQHVTLLSVSAAQRSLLHRLSTPLIIFFASIGVAALHCFGAAYGGSVMVGSTGRQRRRDQVA